MIFHKKSSPDSMKISPVEKLLSYKSLSILKNTASNKIPQEMIYVPQSPAHLLKFISNNNFAKNKDIQLYKVSCHPNNIYTIRKYNKKKNHSGEKDYKQESGNNDCYHIFTPNGYMKGRGMVFNLEEAVSMLVKRQAYQLRKNEEAIHEKNLGQNGEANRNLRVITKDDVVIYVSEIVLDTSRGTYIYSDNCLVNGLISNLSSNFQKYYKVKKSVSYERDLFYLLRLAKII